MAVRRFFAAVALFGFILSAGGRAQSRIDSIFAFNTGTGPNLLSSEYKKRFNTHDFFGAFSYALSDSQYEVSVLEDYHSNIIYSTTRTTRENQRLKVNGGIRAAQNVSFGLAGLMNNYSDSRSTGLNKSASESVEAYAAFHSGNVFYHRASAGFLTNTQIGITDKGYLWDIESIVNSFNVFETDISGLAELRRERINIRENASDRLQVQLLNTFPDRLENLFTVEYGRQRNDFYFPADALISSAFQTSVNAQQRTETVYSLANTVQNLEVIPGHIIASAKISLWERFIERRFLYMPELYSQSTLTPDRIDENRIEFNGNINWSGRLQRTALTLIINQSAERHIILDRQRYAGFSFDERSANEAQKNNSLKRVSVNLNSEFLFHGLSLGYMLSHTKLQYDTPSENNFDDRDEMLSFLRLYGAYMVHPMFSLHAAIEGNLNKLNYLFRERSANNFTNRVLKLVASGAFTGKALRTMNSFEISSFYTVYDFEDLSANFKSFSFRQVSFTDSTRWQPGERLSIEFRGALKYSEQASLYWGRFTVQPLRNLLETFAHPSIAVSAGDFSFSVGYRFNTVAAFGYKNRVKIRETVLRNSGPSSGISYSYRTKIRLFFSGWVENISRTAGSDLSQSNFDFRLQWNL